MVRDERLKKILKVLSKRQKDLRVFMENVKNEHNFSAIIRTCDAVGVMYIHYYYEGDKLPINKGISLGSEKWVFLIREDNPIHALVRLKDIGFQILATHVSEESESFFKVDYTRPTIIVLGNEFFGVSEDILKVSDKAIRIPMVGMAQSLNVSVANAVILYEAYKQRLLKGMYNKLSLSEEEMEGILNLWAYRRTIERG